MCEFEMDIKDFYAAFTPLTAAEAAKGLVVGDFVFEV